MKSVELFMYVNNATTMNVFRLIIVVIICFFSGAIIMKFLLCCCRWTSPILVSVLFMTTHCTTLIHQLLNLNVQKQWKLF